MEPMDKLGYQDNRLSPEFDQQAEPRKDMNYEQLFLPFESRQDKTSLTVGYQLIYEVQAIDKPSPHSSQKLREAL